MIDFTIASDCAEDAVMAARSCSQQLTEKKLPGHPDYERVALVFVCQSMAGDMSLAVDLLKQTLDLSYINLSVNQLVLSQIRQSALNDTGCNNHAPKIQGQKCQSQKSQGQKRQGDMAVLLMTVERGSVFHMTLSSEQIQNLSQADLMHGYLSQFQEQANLWQEHNYPALGIVQSDLGVLPIDDLMLELQTDYPAHLCGTIGLSQDQGFSCLMFSGRAEVAAAVTQSCDPIGPVHEIVDSAKNHLLDLDEQPALTCLKKDVEAFDIARAQQGQPPLSGIEDIFCARRVYDEPKRPLSLLDFLVRPITSYNQNDKSITLPLTEDLDMGEEILFCHRSPEIAERNMHAMLERIQQRAGRLPKAGLYVACFARTVHLFPSPEYEYNLIRAYFPEMPLICSWGQGQISQGNLYQQTGCLTLFF